MPSNPWHVGGGLLALLVVAYSTFVGGAFLIGVAAAGLVYLLGWLVALVSPERVAADMGGTRAKATAAVVLLVLAYAVVIAAQILLGVVAATLVVFVSWVTAPNGPLVRGVRWIRAVRDDLHAVRVAVEDGGAAGRDARGEGGGPAGDD
ncbi:MAG: hypothetical protein ABEJ61_10075 [Haloferacaceae archaeon]